MGGTRFTFSELLWDPPEVVKTSQQKQHVGKPGCEERMQITVVSECLVDLQEDYVKKTDSDRNSELYPQSAWSFDRGERDTQRGLLLRT